MWWEGWGWICQKQSAKGLSKLRRGKKGRRKHHDRSLLTTKLSKNRGGKSIGDRDRKKGPEPQMILSLVFSRLLGTATSLLYSTQNQFQIKSNGVFLKHTFPPPNTKIKKNYNVRFWISLWANHHSLVCVLDWLIRNAFFSPFKSWIYTRTIMAWACSPSSCYSF